MGWIKDIFKKVKNVFKRIVKTANKMWNEGARVFKTILKPLEKPLKNLFRFMGRVALGVVSVGTSEIFGYYNDVLDFVENVGEAVLKGFVEYIRFIATLDPEAIKNAIKLLAPAAIATASTILSGGSALPAAIVLLDAAYNSNALLCKAVEIAGKIETEVFGSTHIAEYSEVIVSAITAVSVAYCGSVVGAEIFSSLGEFIGLSENVANSMRYLESTKSLYDGGMNLYESHVNRRKYADEYNAMLKQLQELEYSKKQQKEELEGILNSFDKWEYYAGGDRFMHTYAGHDGFEAGSLPHVGIFR